MSWGPSVLPAMDGLTKVLAAEPGLAGVDIRFGQQTPDESSAQAIFVGDTQTPGADGQPVDNAADYAAQPEGLGRRLRETFVIHCTAAVLSTEGDWHAAAASAYALAEGAASAVAHHQNLAGAIDGEAWFAGGPLRFQKLDVGVIAIVAFDISVESYTTG